MLRVCRRNSTIFPRSHVHITTLIQACKGGLRPSFQFTGIPGYQDKEEFSVKLHQTPAGLEGGSKRRKYMTERGSIHALIKSTSVRAILRTVCSTDFAAKRRFREIRRAQSRLYGLFSLVRTQHVPIQDYHSCHVPNGGATVHASARRFLSFPMRRSVSVDRV